jgi:hypothetical protein
MQKIFLLIASAFLIVANAPTMAQETKLAPVPAPAPAAAPAPAVAPAAVKPTHDPLVAKHSCKQPEAPGRLGSDNQQKVFVKEMDGYRDCLIAYRTEMNRLAKSHVEAANAAVEEFNDYAASLRKK